MECHFQFFRLPAWEPKLFAWLQLAHPGCVSSHVGCQVCRELSVVPLPFPCGKTPWPRGALALLWVEALVWVREAEKCCPCTEWGECMGKALSCACAALIACVFLGLDVVQASDYAFHVFIVVCFEMGIQLGIKSINKCYLMQGFVLQSGLVRLVSTGCCHTGYHFLVGCIRKVELLTENMQYLCHV